MLQLLDLNYQYFMLIREYQESDKEKIVNLLQEFSKYLHKLDPLDRYNPSSGSNRSFFEKVLQEVADQKGKLLVAEEAGEVVGFIESRIHEANPNGYDNLTEYKKGEVVELFISQKVRNLGAGSKLMQAIETYFRNQNCHLITLDVLASNKLARDFYVRLGFFDHDITMVKVLDDKYVTEKKSEPFS